MPNPALTAAIQESYASAPKGVFLLDTLEISHPSIPAETIFIVRETKSYDLTLEDGVTVETFQPLAFNITLPPAGDKGIQELRLEVDNVDRSISDFFALAKDYRTPVKVVYRPYLNTDLSTPQLDPPLELNLTDVKITAEKVTSRATFADLINKKHPLEMYTRSRFVSLGGN